jgi:hypothetical protein
VAKREYDAIEAMLIRVAAADALQLLNHCDAGGVTKMVRSGDRLLRLRLSVVKTDADDPSPFEKPNTNPRSGMGLPKR